MDNTPPVAPPLGMTQQMSTDLQFYSGIVFCIVFIIEMAVNVLGSGWVSYLSRSPLEFFIVLSSLVELYVDIGSRFGNDGDSSQDISFELITAMRIFRLLRLMRLMRLHQGCRMVSGRHRPQCFSQIQSFNLLPLCRCFRVCSDRRAKSGICLASSSYS